MLNLNGIVFVPLFSLRDEKLTVFNIWEYENSCLY
jgi:hypothetical protein